MTVPAFKYRGFMLDVSRHYMPPDEIRRLLKAAAFLHLNRMHWHLTDDQGWRIEIRKYPLLTERGAVRGDSWFGGTPEKERNCGFYTQTEIRELVQYAKSLGIEVIPEIEIPGHAAAMLAAYPGLGCRRGESGRWEEQVEISGGIFPSLVCAGNDQAISFVKDVLEEVAELFPFPAIHIGGDEAMKLRWRRCPDCQRRIRKNGLASEDDLQRMLVLQIGEFLAGKGKKTIVWNDVLAGGLLPDYFIVQQWRGGERETRAFMENGGSVIRSDTSYFYMDYPYGAIDIKHIWEMPRVPDYAEGLEDRLLGVECPLWTERVADFGRAAYLLFPRLTAMSLRASGGAEGLDWNHFRERTALLETELEAEVGLRGAPEDQWELSCEEAEAERAAEERKIFSGRAGTFERKERKVVLLEQAERLAETLGIPRAFVTRGGDGILAEMKDEAAGEDDGASELIRQLMTAVESRGSGAWKNIPEAIWTDTMRCFSRFVAEHRRFYGRDGFDRYGWTTRQIEAKLFRIGELEYELKEAESGQKEISLHIPSDVRLEPERLNASLREAKAFFLTFFPAWADAPRTCESWLLSPVLKELLPPGSRILMFQEAFDLRKTDPEDDAALEWVFYIAQGQRENLNLSDLPENTSLQRKMKAMMLKGGKPGSASGILKQETFGRKTKGE